MKLFYDPAYSQSGVSFETTQKSTWIADRLQKYPLRDVDIAAPPLLEEGLLTSTHTHEYVDAIRTGSPVDLASSQGFQWNEQLFGSVMASNGGAVQAALQSLKDGVSGSLSSGLHHAREDRGSGFCTFNGLVLAAKAAIQQGARKVLILDLDAHCGGGTNNLIEHTPEIFHLDISVNAFDSYTPMRSSDTLTIVRDSSEYLATIGAALQRHTSSEQSFDLCIYNAGVDPFEDCRIGGLRGISQSVLASREGLVFQWFRERRIPVAFVLAGGYISTNLTRDALVDLHIQTIRAACSR
jgi:acetoin utilization deacetylase AcuC-like enzyme